MSVIVDLTREENNLIKQLVKKILADPFLEPQIFCSQAREYSKLLPTNIKLALNKFINLVDSNINNYEMAHLLFRNIEFDSSVIPETPCTNNERVGEKTDLAKFQSLLIYVIGEMIAYEAEGYGRLFQDIIPIKKNEDMQISVSSKFELEMHTEQAFSKVKPDIVCLGCLQGDPNAYTYILPVKKILEYLSSDEIDMLYKPLWRIGVDLSFKQYGVDFIEGEIREGTSILSGSKEDPLLIFDHDLMEGTTQESNELLKKIADIYYKQRIEYKLNHNEILLINNNKAVHGRSRFTPKYDGTDRFLVRCFGMFDYEKTKYARPNNGRVVSARFS